MLAVTELVQIQSLIRQCSNILLTIELKMNKLVNHTMTSGAFLLTSMWFLMLYVDLLPYSLVFRMTFSGH